MMAFLGTIVAIVQSYVSAVVVAIVGSILSAATQALVVNMLTTAVLLVVTGAILQVVGKLLGIEKVTDAVAKVLYTIAIIIIVIAAIIAQSIMLGLVFLGGAFVFLYLVDTVFGTNASSTFVEAASDVVAVVGDLAAGIIDAVVDVVGTGLNSLFGGKFLTYLLLGVAGFVGYKMLTKPKDGVTYVASEKQRGDGRGWGNEQPALAAGTDRT